MSAVKSFFSNPDPQLHPHFTKSHTSEHIHAFEASLVLDSHAKFLE